MLILLGGSAPGCRREPSGGEIKPVYDPKSGQLSQLVYDRNRDGRPDTWSYTDGTRIVRIEVDTNHDGVVDRWEYYDAAGKLEKVGASGARDTIVDTWLYPNPDGSIARVDQSTRRDGRVTRVEFYAGGRIARAEEDTDDDGRIDKWETYEGPVIASVAYDTTRQGKPDRRFVYKPDGSLDRIEDGDGRLLPPGEPAAAPPRPGNPPRPGR